MIGLMGVALGLVSVLLTAAYWLLRRQRRALQEFTQRVQRIAVGGSLYSRITQSDDQPAMVALTTAVNHLLARASTASPATNSAVPAINGKSNGSANTAGNSSDAQPIATVAAGAATPLNMLADRVHEAVLIHGASGILFANRKFAEFLGAPGPILIGEKLADLVPPDYTDLVADHVRRGLAGEAPAERYEVDLVGLQGQASRLELSSWCVEYNQQDALLIIGVEVLPTQTVAALGSMDGTVRSRARLALDALTEAVLTTDARGRIDYLNAAASELLDVGIEAARGMELDALTSIADEGERKSLADPVRQALKTGAALNLGRRAVTLARNGGSERTVELSAAPIREPTGDNIGVVIMLHDVTEARGLSRQMSYQATHDALTGLFNRREFERRVQDHIEIARGSGGAVLCYLDLDRFKLVNDSGGHLAGDGLLRDLAKLLREAVRDSDSVARIGGDEFGVLLPGCPLEKAQQIADNLCRRVSDFRFLWKDRVFEIGVSIGLVEIGRESGSIEQLMAAADAACYVAKRQGGHVAVYSAADENQARASGEIHWLQALQSALKDRKFDLYRQPITAVFAGDDPGPAMEVLMRLKGENGECITPQSFLGAAERYRLMPLIDRRVVQATLSALGNGDLVLPPRRSVAINISGQTLADAQFLEFVVECFDSTGANPAQVCFEITERAAMANLDFAKRFVGVLHGMGCRFALDDFGGGLGSLAQLKHLAIDYLKLDGTFMRNLGRDAVNQEMVTAIMRMARALNIKVIAEQLEDIAAVDAARRIGVDYLQGFAVARPESMALAA
jgi:diguanylate cyclase (GGDEF)-like protein/PAS domain S-box-containing protein